MYYDETKSILNVYGSKNPIIHETDWNFLIKIQTCTVKLALLLDLVLHTKFTFICVCGCFLSDRPP